MRYKLISIQRESNLKRIILSIQEPIISTVVHSMLRDRDFDIQDIGACVRPNEADDCKLECFSNEERPDLLILDVVIDRDCTGVEAAHKALQRFPGVKILLTSATPPLVWPDSARVLFDALPAHGWAFLSKPFTAQQLHAAVTALLDGENGRSR